MNHSALARTARFHLLALHDVLAAAAADEALPVGIALDLADAADLAGDAYGILATMGER